MNHISDLDLSKIIDNDIESSRMTELHEHLNKCSVCQQNLNEMKNLDLSLKTITMSKDLSLLNDKIMKKINPHVKFSSDGKAFFISLISIFSLAVIITITLIVNYSAKYFTLSDNSTIINETVISRLENWMVFIKQLFTKSNIELFSTISLLIILISVYFIYDNFKKGNSIYNN